MLLVIDKIDRLRMLQAAHDCIGHQGIYATSKLLLQRFWWPDLETDVVWYVRSCHVCQIRQKIAMEIPPMHAFPMDSNLDVMGGRT